MNATARTIGLFCVLTLLFMGIGYLLGMYFGNTIFSLGFFLTLALLVNLFTYFYSSNIILWSYRARIINEEDNPRLYQIVKKVAMNANLPTPKVALVPLSIPNAFATGRNKKYAVICVTEGLLLTLNNDELEGVIGHEMGHIKDRDILLMSVAATITGALSFMSRAYMWRSFVSRDRDDFLIYIVLALAAFGALLIQLAISREREFKADEQSAKITKKPLALASALRKLEYHASKNPLKRGNPSTASLFIVNPFRSDGLIRLFSTHPPTEERIKRLEDMARNFSYL